MVGGLRGPGCVFGPFCGDAGGGCEYEGVCVVRLG